MNNFSVNKLKTFEQCPQKFFLKYIEKISLPQISTIFEKGKKIHALANYFLNGFDISKMEKTLNPDEKSTWEALKANKYFKLQVINTEYSLTCKVDKYWINGRLDALVMDKKDYIILDYKTGQIPQNAQDDFQTVVYLLCADKLIAKKGGYDSLKFIYLGLKNDVEKEIILNDNLKKLYEEKITDTCKKIDFAIDSKVFQINQEHCKNCEYNKKCSRRVK